VIYLGGFAVPILSAAATVPSVADEGFSMSRMGGHQYGTNGIGVWTSGRVRVGLSDTIQTEFNGAGIIENQLTSEDVKQARDIHRQLCEIADSKPATDMKRIDPPTVYSASCVQNGKKTVYQGRIDELPRELCFLMDSFYLRTRDSYARDGRAIAKLDVSVESIVRQRDGFQISVKFINSGDYPMITLPPDHWSGVWGEDLIWIHGQSADGKHKWNVDLSALPLINKADFPGDTVTIPPRSSVTYKFLTLPDEKLIAGIYSFEAQVFMSVGAEDGPVASMGKVDFHSDRTKPTRVTFDRDYPSTPQEWKDFEARKAKEVSFLMPGATVAESGYYRAASIAGTRDQFVRKFEQGTAAPDLDFQRWDRWEWEADLARATVCKPGETCPREGRWILRAKDYSYGSKGDLTYPQHQQLFRMGEQSRSIDVANVDGSRLFWEWLSA